MKNLHVLLGNCDRTLNNRIEAILRDVCFERAVVEFSRTGRSDEFVQMAGFHWMDLIIFAPDNLYPQAGRKAVGGPFAEGLRAARLVRSESEIPMIAVNVSEHNKLELLEAGVNAVVGIPFQAAAFGAELRTLLNYPADEEPATDRFTESGSGGGWFGRLSWLLGKN